ncbi:MAG: hypothetical protein WBD47_11790 [Phormidesmis sp.]
MFISAEGAAASTLLTAAISVVAVFSPRLFLPNVATAATPNFPADADPQTPRDHVRHLLFGTPQSVQATIKLLHKLGYAEPNDWSQPISTGRAGEVMAILTKRVSAG